MELIISFLMGTRLLALFGGGLGGEAAPVFLEPRIIVASDEVRLTCSLAHAVPGELSKLARTGTPVVLYVVVTATEADSRLMVSTVTLEHRLVYDVINERFCVSRSTGRDTLCYGTMDSASTCAATFQAVPVVAKKKIRKDRSYIFSAQAILGKTRVEALDNKEIDCMYYWNYKRPTFKTGMIAGDRLLPGSRGSVPQ